MCGSCLLRRSGAPRGLAEAPSEGPDGPLRSAILNRVSDAPASGSVARHPAPVLVVDFGAQYAQLIARRVREAHVYSEIVPSTITADEVRAAAPGAIILSGGPKSVYETPAPTLDPAIYDLGIPVLGICYGAQLMAMQLGGHVAHTGASEYGRTELRREAAPSQLMDAWPALSSCWMSHGDAIATVPDGFVVTARSPGVVAAMEDSARRLYGVQFHPEVAHTERGAELLSAFVHHVAGLAPTWTNTSII